MKRTTNRETQRCLDRLVATNYVATVNLNVRDIDLQRIAQQQPACTYHRRTFAAMSFRLKNPRTTALIYPLGVMVCMGARTKASALFACQKYVRALNDFGVKCQMTGFKIDNVVSSTLSFPLDLKKCDKPEWSAFIRLTDRFPGARLRCQFMNLPIQTKIVMELFSSGKINITGGITLEEEKQVYEYVDEIVLQKLRRDGGRYVRARRGGGRTREDRMMENNPGLISTIERLEDEAVVRAIRDGIEGGDNDDEDDYDDDDEEADVTAVAANAIFKDDDDDLAADDFEDFDDLVFGGSF